MIEVDHRCQQLSDFRSSAHISSSCCPYYSCLGNVALENNSLLELFPTSTSTQASKLNLLVSPEFGNSNSGIHPEGVDYHRLDPKLRFNDLATTHIEARTHPDSTLPFHEVRLLPGSTLQVIANFGPSDIDR